MPSSKPAAAPDSAADSFYAGHRLALPGDPAVTGKKMFGTTALCAGGKVFLFPWRDTLVVKIPAAQAQELVTAEAAEPFDPGHGRPGKTWAAVYPSASDLWPQLALAARAFAGG